MDVRTVPLGTPQGVLNLSPLIIMTFSPTTEDFLGLASDHQEQADTLTQAMDAEYLQGATHALGSTPTPLPYADQSNAYKQGYRDGREEWLESCL